MSTLQQVLDVLASTLNVAPDAVNASTQAGEFAPWDSLGHVNLMMSLEQAFGLELDVEDFPRLTSVDAIVKYLESMGVR